MKYEVLVSHGNMLEAKMQIEAHAASMIADGWEPTGGISMVRQEYEGAFFRKEVTTILAQAMIKR